MDNLLMSKSTLSGVCFLIIEILFLLMFLLFLISGICTTVNIGNIIGCIVSAAVFIFCVKRYFFCELIIRMKGTVWGRIVLTSAAVVVIFAVITAAVISVLMISAMNRLPEKPANIIVLGCRVKQEGPSLMLDKRIEAAYEYMSENPEVLCIASGGQGSDEPCTEAEAIRTGLMARGISADRIILEDKSENTFQNIRNSLEIMDKLGMERKAVIITSEFHQLRAKILSDKQGLESYSKSSSTFLPLLPSYWIREWVGVLHEIIIGRK
ncbi:MAG: YdcF family protein [Huintestinicola sp.]